VVADGIFKLLEEKCFLDELGEFGVMGIEKRDEDGVGVNLRGGGRVVRECGE